MSRLPLAAICVVLATTFVGCSQFNSIAVPGSGQIEREERPVSSFTKVTLSGEGELIIQQGDTEELTIEADHNLFEYLKTEVNGNELNIGTKDGYDPRPTKPIRYFVTVKNVDAVSISGSGSVTAEEFTGEKLAISISGSAEAKLAYLDVKELTVSISGSGKVMASGKTDKISVKIAGSGEIRTKDLQTKEVKVSVAGSGDAEVWATDKLDVSVAGSGDVRYKGEARVKQNVAGSGSVSKLK